MAMALKVAPGRPTQRAARPVTETHALITAALDSLDQASLNRFDLLATPVWVWDFDQAKVWWANRSAVALWGARDIAELSGRTLEISDGDRERLACYKRRLAMRKNAQGSWVTPFDGQAAGVRCQLSPVRIDGGRLGAFVEPVSDIVRPADTSCDPLAAGAALPSERRVRLLEDQNEVLEYIAKGATLEQSLEYLARVIERTVDSAKCAISLFEHDGGRLRCITAPNLPAEFLDAVNGMKTGPGGSPCGLAAYRREPVVTVDLAAETPWSRFRGVALPFGIRACWSQPILDQEGEALGAISLYYDKPHDPDEEDIRLVDAMGPIARLAIQHVQQAQALQSANSRFAKFAANVPGVVYQRLVTPDGTIRYTYISDGARDLFGVSPEEIMKDPDALFDCHGPEYRETFRERLLTASRELTMWDVEAPIITRDGRHKWTHAIARPQRQPDGSVLWDGVILDATRIKEANLELEASNRAKSEFLANMSHELRTPLNAIIGFSEVMADEALGELGHPQYKDYVGDIHNSGTHLLQVINDILDLAKIEAGKLELNEDTVYPCQMINNCIRLVRERAEENGIALTVEGPQDDTRLHADERKLKQVLINLLSNAVKFSADGDAIAVKAEIDADGAFVISVSDTGIGISEENIARVFEPFVQADSSLSRNFEGTGLGLPTAKALVELHGGTIDLKSQIDVGTFVTVRIPAYRTIAPDTDA